MELLTLEEAKALMLRLRQRWSALSKLEDVREQEWRAQHPAIVDLEDRLHALLEEFKECAPDYYADDPRPLTVHEENLQREIKHISDELAAQPKPSPWLTESESNERRAIMSQFQQLRNGLKSHLPAHASRPSPAR